MTADPSTREDPAAAGLEIRDLEVQFATHQGWVTVINGVDLVVRPNQTVGLVGESGSGKSVTSLAAMGLLPKRTARVTRGEILLDGTDLRRLDERAMADVRGARMSMVFQEPMTSLNPTFTIGDQIIETIRRHDRVSRKAALKTAVDVLDLVGVPGARRRLDDYPHMFSGGMRQRVMIAIAVSCRPQILLADEPTTALDVTVQAQVLELLRRLQQELGMGVLLVTHDLGVVAEICDHVAVMYAGQIVEEADSERLFDAPSHPYTEALLNSMVTADLRGHVLPVIPGRVPPAHAMPTGCRFHPRCDYAIDRCVSTPPDLVPYESHRTRCVRHGEISLSGVSSTALPPEATESR